MSKRSSKLKTAVMVILVIILLILSLGLLGRLTNVFGNKITVRYNGTKITKDFEGLEIESGTEIEVRAPGEYEVKIYAAGTEATDFTFTVGGTEYSWVEDIAGANGGRGEEFTEVFEIEKTEKGFKISGGIKKVLKDIWPGKEIILPEELPAGDRFRMEIRSGKTTLTVGFSVKEPGSVGVEKIELAPGEIVF
jgi:hypothetical protein